MCQCHSTNTAERGKKEEKKKPISQPFGAYVNKQSSQLTSNYPTRQPCACDGAPAMLSVKVQRRAVPAVARQPASNISGFTIASTTAAAASSFWPPS